jgi:hypothetical protein
MNQEREDPSTLILETLVVAELKPEGLVGGGERSMVEVERMPKRVSYAEQRTKRASQQMCVAKWAKQAKRVFLGTMQRHRRF